MTTERDILYQRINDRVDKMIENGLVEEVKSLKDKYLTSRVLNTGIGYKEFYDYLFEDVSLEKVIDCIKKDSRRFAKRQYTFFNHQFDVNWFEVNFLDFSKTKRARSTVISTLEVFIISKCGGIISFLRIASIADSSKI